MKLIWTSEIADLAEKIKNIALPEEILRTVKRELERLKQTPALSPEAGIIHTYIDWFIDLPWQKISEDNLNVQHARKVLDENHYGLRKQRIGSWNILP